MEAMMAALIGVLHASGLYLMLRRSVVKLIIGLVLLSHGTNLLVLTAGGLIAGRSAILPPVPLAPSAPPADPLPQALILTAIVINFGILAFSIVLIGRVHRLTGRDDVDEMQATER